MKTLRYIARFESKVRTIKDQRKKRAKIVGAYFDSAGEEYRRGFYFPLGTTEVQAREKIPKTISDSDWKRS